MKGNQAGAEALERVKHLHEVAKAMPQHRPPPPEDEEEPDKLTLEEKLLERARVTVSGR